VITPCYNQGHFLAEAIDSVLGQTYPGVEHIVVDDGSTDQTSAVASRYGDRIRYIRKENGGLSAARNTGILAAAGEFVLFMDSDDYLRPDALEHHMEAARAHPAASVFHSAHEVINREGRHRSWHEAESLGPDPFHTLLLENRFPPHAHLIRRSAFARVGFFDGSLMGSEDWDMWLRLAAAKYEFIPVPGAVAVYRAYSSSMSKQFDRMWSTGVAVLRKSLAYHGSCSLCRKATAQGIRRMRVWCFELLVKELYAEKTAAGVRASIAKAVHAMRRDPILAAWFCREFVRYLQGAHAHSTAGAPAVGATSS
jgi:glycosyltransferase involved in cell wall biosynthesis